ncbi:hypothetical protein Tco_1024560 [Tanacetum coccineum]
MAKQVELNKKKGKGTSQGENRPVRNNVQRLNHQNQFVPTAVLTRTSRIPVNTGRQNLSSQTATTSTAKKFNTARPIVNEIRPRNNFYKFHSPIRMPFNRTTAPRTNFSNHKVSTVVVKAVSVVEGIRETAVKPSAVKRWTLDDMMMIWSSLYSFLRATYGAKLVSAASLINTARPKLSTARLGWCCSKVFNNGVDAWIGSKMQSGLDLRLGEPFNDVYITPAHTLKVFSNMSRKGVKFSGKVTPLFDSMLVPHQAPEGEGSEQPTEPQPTPSPTQPSTGDQPPVTDSSSSHDTTQDSRDSLEGTNGSEGDQVQPSHDSNLSGGPTSDRAKGGMTLEELSVLCTNLSNRVLALEASKDAQATKIIKLKAKIKKLKKKSHPVISHHKAWLRSVSRLSMKRKLGRKESVSKQGRKNAKPGPTLDDSTFDDLDADHGMDYMDTEEPVNEGRLSKETEELNVTHDTEVLEKGGSNEEPVSAAGNTGVSTVVPETTFQYLYDDVQAKMDASETLALDFKWRKDRCIQLKKDKGRYKKCQLNKKTLEEIQALYIKEQERAANFVPISTKVEARREEIQRSTRKRPGRRLKMKATKKSKRQKTDSDLEEEEQLKAFLMIVPDEEGEIDYEVLDKRYPIVDWESKFYHTDRYGKPHDYYRVFRADGSSRYIKTFTEMVSRFDRLDFIELHSLVMKRFETSTPEGIDLILWGSLRTMFEANAEDDLWKNQEEWILKSWNFYDNCGVHILVLEDGTEFYMLAERRYPLTKETLERMLALRLIAESESEAVFDLLRFIQKQIDESGSHDGSEKDL